MSLKHLFADNMPPWTWLAVVLTVATSTVLCSEDLDVDDPSTVVLTNIVCFQNQKMCLVLCKILLQIFRHGDRTPVDPYPTDPYRNLTFWPEGYGQLTDVCINY